SSRTSGLHCFDVRTTAALSLHSSPTRRSSDLDHWTQTLNMPSSAALRSLWESMGSVFEWSIVDNISERDARWKVLQPPTGSGKRSEEHTSELQSRFDLVCRLLLAKKKEAAHRQ